MQDARVQYDNAVLKKCGRFAGLVLEVYSLDSQIWLGQLGSKLSASSVPADICSARLLMFVAGKSSMRCQYNCPNNKT